MQIFWPPHGSPENYMLGEYVSFKVFGEPGHFRDYTSMGVVDDGTLVAAMIFHDYDRKAGVIQVSGAAEHPSWMTRQTLREMHEFVFDQLGCQCLVMRVPETNKRLERILTAGRYVKHVIPRLRGRNENETIYQLFDDEWKNSDFWQKIRREVNHGQESSTADTAP